MGSTVLRSDHIARPSQIAHVRDILSGQGNGASTHRQMAFAGIALIGLRGAGKSTLGKLLADKIGWSFVELNREIERQNGLSVAEDRHGGAGAVEERARLRAAERGVVTSGRWRNCSRRADCNPHAKEGSEVATSLRAKRSNPGRKQDWIASSQVLLAKTG
jgi:hypothetical protein